MSSTPTTYRKRLVESEAELHETRETDIASALTKHEAAIRADEGRKIVREIREAHESQFGWNLRDPQDPETSYSVDLWIEVRADRIEQEAQA